VRNRGVTPSRGWNLGNPSVKAIVAVICSIAVLSTGARADEIFKGKTINLLIGYPPGGGYDTYGRLLARHLGNHIPGNPAVVPSNMPGAGSIVLANYLFNEAPKDGTAIGVVTGDAALNPLFGQVETRYDSLQMSWLGSMNQETSTCLAWHSSPVHSIRDVFSQTFTIGSSSSTGTTYSYPASSNYLFGTKFKIISGYDGTNGVMLAVERGEIQGMCGTAWNSLRSMRPQWLRNHDVTMILQEATTRNPSLPDVPSVMDLAQTKEQKEILELIYGWQIMGRPVAAPPGLSPERLAVLRQAFDATMKDPAFLKEASTMTLDINPITGQEVTSFLTGIYATPKDVVEKAARALGRSKSP
jgi:tripartite-type tricarboxylate transporter receptor subunit TctC